MCGYIIDLDGTIYLGDRVVRGATGALAELRARGRKVVFLSNKPLESRSTYAEKLSRMGIPASESDVLSSSFVLARHMAKVAPRAWVFAVGEPPLLEELERAGLRITEDPSRIEHVIAAFDRTFDYRKLNLAFQALRRGAGFWATNPDRTCPVDGGEIPDAAGVIAALEATTGRSVERVAGKPSSLMAETALSVLGLTSGSCAMVGDRLETDIRMANQACLISILVLSGVTRREDLPTASDRPDHVLESIAELPKLDSTLQSGLKDVHGG